MTYFFSSTFSSISLLYNIFNRISTRYGQQAELKEQNQHLIATNEELQKNLTDTQVQEVPLMKYLKDCTITECSWSMSLGCCQLQLNRTDVLFHYTPLKSVLLCWILFNIAAKSSWVGAAVHWPWKGECRVTEKPEGLSCSPHRSQNRPRWMCVLIFKMCFF